MKKLPRSKFNGTQKEVRERARERARIMEERHPGTKFSLFIGNKLGIRLARKLGIPGAGLPQAIFNPRVELVDDPEKIQSVVDAADAYGDLLTGYITYTTLQQATQLSFDELFGVLAWMRQRLPTAVSMSVNRLGQNTVVKINWPRFLNEK